MAQVASLKPEVYKLGLQNLYRTEAEVSFTKQFLSLRFVLHLYKPWHVAFVRKLHNLIVTFCYHLCGTILTNCCAVQLNKIDDTANCQCRV